MVSSQGLVAECPTCKAVVPIDAPECPQCGALFATEEPASAPITLDSGQRMRTAAVGEGSRMEWWMGYSGSGFRPSNVPVEEGKVYEAKIEDIGREGDGLARIANFVVFVPGTKIGDEVKIKITKVHRRMAFGEVVRE